MKKNYLKPEVKVLEMEANTTMMTGSDGLVDTGMGETPSRPDVRGRRGTWGNLWRTED